MQEDKTAPDRIISYQKPDTNRTRGSMKFEEPEPADGWINYNTYIANNIQMPDNSVKRSSLQLSFDVDQNGDPVDVRVEKSLCQKCDEEAARLIKQGPKWKKKDKKSKRVTVAVPLDSSHSGSLFLVKALHSTNKLFAMRKFILGIIAIAFFFSSNAQSLKTPAPSPTTAP